MGYSLQPMFDLISASLTLTATITTTSDNVKFNMQYYPIGVVNVTTTNTIEPTAHVADFIAGIPYTDSPDCKPALEIPPGGTKVSSVCALIPHGATDIHFIILGDTCVIYETKVPNAAK